MVSRIFRAYGRAARMRSCVRLSFAAATIFIAFVIFWVFLTESIFRRTDCRLGIMFSNALMDAQDRAEGQGTICYNGRSRYLARFMEPEVVANNGMGVVVSTTQTAQEVTTCSTMNYCATKESYWCGRRGQFKLVISSQWRKS